MISKISTIFFAVAIVIAMSASTVMAAHAPSGGMTSTQDVSHSRHNLGSGGQWNTVTDTNRVCVFCHTPHGAVAMAAVPLWNKGTGTLTTYKNHEMPEVQGTSGSRGVGSVSILCLQCHDGTQAIDTMINAPGSGWSPSGAVGAGPNAPVAQGWTFKEFTKYSETPGLGYEGGDGPSEASYLGTNLMNDHPVSIGFAEGTCNANGCSAVDDNYNTPSGTAGDDTLSFDNTIKVILRAAADFGYTTIDPYTVECSSCHNPHIGTSDTDGSAGSTVSIGSGTPSEMFLRVANNDNSGVCLTCHIK